MFNENFSTYVFLGLQSENPQAFFASLRWLLVKIFALICYLKGCQHIVSQPAEVILTQSMLTHRHHETQVGVA